MLYYSKPPEWRQNQTTSLKEGKKEKKMEATENICLMDAENIEPLHEFRDEKKLKKLIDSMRTDGWQGRPILVLDSNALQQALTGSHRITAAKSLGMQIPVLLFESTGVTSYYDEWYDEIVELWDTVINGDDCERLKALESLFESGEIEDEEVVKLMASELEANDQETEVE
jgi:hypothetical protein